MPETLTKKPAVLPRSQAKPTGRPEAQWQVLAYLAADNDLEGELLTDLAEMERVGSRPGVVEVLAQVDRSPGNDMSKGNWHGTRRYYVTHGSDPRKINSRLLVDLGPTNTGDPGVLESFIRFGAHRYPARSTALVISNHGSGFYVPPEMLSRAAGPARSSPARRRRRPIFHTTRERLREATPASRGIAYDDGAADCLDNQELRRVLATAHRVLGRKVDLVGMDACLMTMIEVAYQLREHVDVLVGSEEVEPGPGWPHAAILGDLRKSPTMTPAELGAAVVQRYIESYRHAGEAATQSAIDLGQLDDVVEAVDQLARQLLAGIKAAVVSAALMGRGDGRSSSTMACTWTCTTSPRTWRRPPVSAASPTHVTRSSERSRRDGKQAIIARGQVGAGLAPARGLSIYFPPFRDPSIHYRDLDFARRTRWADLLDAYLSEGRSRRASINGSGL